mgnify:CR=1 FL=1|jgi:hypothetical protein
MGTTIRERLAGLPISEPLLRFLDRHEDFRVSLKLNNRADFQLLPVFLTSRLPEGDPPSSKQVLGLWYLDKKNHTFRLKKPTAKKPLFKQDFIVELGDDTFVSFAIGRFVSPPRVLHIDDFFATYGANGQYQRPDSPDDEPWAHHYDNLEDLPIELRAAGAAALEENRLHG